MPLCAAATYWFEMHDAFGKEKKAVAVYESLTMSLAHCKVSDHGSFSLFSPFGYFCLTHDVGVEHQSQHIPEIQRCGERCWRLRWYRAGLTEWDHSLLAAARGLA